MTERAAIILPMYRFGDSGRLTMRRNRSHLSLDLSPTDLTPKGGPAIIWLCNGMGRIERGMAWRRRLRIVSHIGSRVRPVNKNGELFSDGDWARAQQYLELSPRQTEIVRHILQGKSDKQIAVDLGISLATVRTHLRRLFAKHNLNDRLELTLLMLATLRGPVQHRQLPE